MDFKTPPNDIDACHQLIATLHCQVGNQATDLQQQATDLSFKDKLIEEQAHRVLKFKDEVLRDFKGNLIRDCWSGFQKIPIRSDSRITFAACWAHARRKIDECRSAFPVQSAKLESLIRMLYEVEDQIKDLDDGERLARRQSLSRHVLDLIAEYLDSEAMQSPRVLPKSNLGGAAGYVRRHWTALCRFTEDATIPIDNNDCEQLMKRVATGRKNWMFKGSVAAGERAANPTPPTEQVNREPLTGSGVR